jgi:hypothetical protein
MSQIFLSHVEEDGQEAIVIAGGLEKAGYSTWYYERATKCAASRSQEGGHVDCIQKQWELYP